ncbi:hypothetical protein GCM10023350_23270 [Nocardioides endophyticus]|uniref:DUF861 domain-containing protein n=1 Tax=Nocardioides endophyticus TaxID=1353775 RepID=A0ABP8YUD1_9ACTN
MTATASKTIYVGNRNLNPVGKWTPFEWEDPKHGQQAKGEVVVIRPEGTSGSLMSGLWRTGHEIAGCEADGSCWVKYSAPVGDETMVILEGTAVITETATGKKHRVGAGSIVANPKHVDLYWEIDAPFLKKFWVMWDSPTPATPETDLIIGDVHDLKAQWTPFSWTEPELGRQTYGEVNIVRPTGSTGTYTAGVWRMGAGMPGSAADGTTTFRYTAPLGDHTLFLLEGGAQVSDDATGDVYELGAGDVIGLSAGAPVTWTSTGPYFKAFFVISNADLPA